MARRITSLARESMRQFLRLESAGGMLLGAATLLALLLANSPLATLYTSVLETHLTIKIGDLGVDKPLLLWINDALMAVFFMLIGLELKREMVEGQLSRPEQVVGPALAALGGLAVPAAVYWLVNRGDAEAMQGWAVPTATDIAFALAVLGVLGSRVPVALKVFLTTVAIVDDLAAIVIIAVFYTSDLSLMSLALAAGGVVALAALNRFGVQRLAAYMLVGLFIWFCVLKSGVHATLAGVVVALFIPLRASDDASPARHLEHALHPWVAYAILPVFAFANAGVSFRGVSLETFTSGVTLGIILALFIGKQVGVMATLLLARALGVARLPEGTSWGQMYGVATLCGVGFTMSLFIGSLAFEHGYFDLLEATKLGVLVASFLSAAWGLLILHLSLPHRPADVRPPA